MLQLNESKLICNLAIYQKTSQMLRTNSAVNHIASLNRMHIAKMEKKVREVICALQVGMKY